MKICAKCNARTIEDRAIYCPFCGRPFIDGLMAGDQQEQVTIQNIGIEDGILPTQASVQDAIQPPASIPNTFEIKPLQGQKMPEIPAGKGEQTTAGVSVQNEGAYQFISRKSKSKTVLLCAFLGIFGAHHFYAGNTTWGFVYLYTLGFWGVGVIVNIVQLIRDDYCDADGKYIMV